MQPSPSSRELAEAFAPCTLEGLADACWEMNMEISRIRKERDAIERILLEHSAAHHNGAEEAFREGEVIQGKTAPPGKAVWRLVDNFPVRWEPRWEFERKDKGAT